MARPALVFKIVETVINDTVEFFADNENQTFTCVDSSDGLGINEYGAFGTATPETAAQSFKKGLTNTLSSNYSIIRDGKIVVILAKQGNNPNFDFGDVTIDNGGGSNIQLLSQRNSDGEVVINPDTRAVRLNVTSVKHFVPQLYSSLEFTQSWGSASDIVQTEIEFFAVKPFDIIDFKFGYVPNSTEVFQQDQNTGKQFIPDELFVNFETGLLQSYTIDIPNSTYNAKPPLGWDKTIDLSYTNLGGGNYRITHTHLKDGFVRSADINDNGGVTVPSEFEGAESIQYIFNIQTRSDIVSTQPNQDSDLGNVQSRTLQGNNGYFGEFLNGQKSDFDVLNFAFTNTENNIDYSVDTPATFNIVTTGADFTTGSKVTLYIQNIDVELEDDKNFFENYNLDYVTIDANGSLNNGTFANILDFTAEVDGVDSKQLNCSFIVKAYEYVGRYAVFVTVNNDNVAAQHTRFLLRNGTAQANVDTSDWILEARTDSNTSDIGLLPHYASDTVDNFNNIVVFNSDYNLCQWRFTDNSSDKTIETFQIQLISQSTGESFFSREIAKNTIDNNNGTVILDTGFILNETDPRNKLQVINVGNQYDFDVLVQTWENMTGVEDLVFSFTVNGEQTFLTGETASADKEWQTAIWGYQDNANPTDYTNIASYDESRNTGGASDPIYTLKEMIYQELGDPTQLVSIVRNGTTKIQAVFEPDAIPSGIDPNNINGYFVIVPCDGGQLQARQFHSLFNPESDSPFEDWDDSGNTTFADIDYDGGTGEITIRANLNWDKLKLAYPQNDNFYIFARPDIVQTFAPPTTYLITGNTRNPNLDTVIFDTSALESPTVIADLLDASTAEFNYTVDGVPQASVGDFQTALTNIVGTVEVTAEDTNLSYIDSGLIIQHTEGSGAPTTTEIRYNWDNDIPVNDIVIWFDREIQFSSFTAPTGVQDVALEVRTQNPQNEDWTVFTYDNIGSQLAAINSDIASASALGPYAIHIKASKQANIGIGTDLIMPFTFSDADTYLDQIVYPSSTNVDFNFGNCVAFEATAGGNCNITISDAGVNNFFDWSQAQPCTFSMWYRYNNSTGGSTQTLFQRTSGSGLRFRMVDQADGEVEFGYFQGSTTTNTSCEEYNATDEYCFYQMTYDGSQDVSGFKFYINGIEMRTFSAINNLNPGDATVAPAYLIGQNNNSVFGNQTWKVRNVILHDRVLSGEEIRRMYHDIDFVPASGLFRHYDMSQLSPSWLANPEVIYERVNDLNLAVLNNHSNNRVPF